ncbi:interleukin-18 [Thomomys bottae]
MEEKGRKEAGLTLPQQVLWHGKEPTSEGGSKAGPEAVSSPHSTFFLIDTTAVYSWAARSSQFSAFRLWLLKRLPPSFSRGLRKDTLNLPDHSLLQKQHGTEMAAVPAEDSFINFVEMRFIDGMLYFIGKYDTIVNIDDCVQLGKKLRKELLNDSFPSPKLIVILWTHLMCITEDLEPDYFGKLEQYRYSIIRNLDNQVLFVYQGKMPIFQDMTDSDCRDNASQTKLKIHMYKDSQARGLAVTISAKYKKTYTLSCENKTISFKEIEPPLHIRDTKSDIIFFQKSVPGHDDKMQFESSLYEGYFLACKKEDDFFRLILKKNEYGDMSVMFTVQNER